MAARFWCRFLSVHGICSLHHRLLMPANFGHGNVLTRSSDTPKTWTAPSDLHLGRRCNRHACCTLHVVQRQKWICVSGHQAHCYFALGSTLLQDECPVQVERGHCPVHMFLHDVFVLCTIAAVPCAVTQNGSATGRVQTQFRYACSSPGRSQMMKRHQS